MVVRNSDARITVLNPDGTSATQRTSGINYGNNGEITIDDRGIVQIELIDNTWHIIRYPLPSG